MLKPSLFKLSLLKPSLVAIALCLIPSATLAADLPKPEPNGNYSSRTPHTKWQVVDADPAGLNCRWSTTAPKDWLSPAATWKDTNFSNWSVVKRFKKGDVLKMHTGSAGWIQMRDDRDTPWFRVRLDANDRICLIRGNAKFVRPL